MQMSCTQKTASLRWEDQDSELKVPSPPWLAPPLLRAANRHTYLPNPISCGRQWRRWPLPKLLSPHSKLHLGIRTPSSRPRSGGTPAACLFPISVSNTAVLHLMWNKQRVKGWVRLVMVGNGGAGWWELSSRTLDAAEGFWRTFYFYTRPVAKVDDTDFAAECCADTGGCW